MRFVVPSEPRGKARPRFVRATGRTYTDTPTLRAEQRIADAWRATGAERPPDVPLELWVTLVLARPRSHFRANGELNAAGLRTPVPVRKPDVDNALKLVMDALNGLAYRDDVQIVAASVSRRWAGQTEAAHTAIGIYRWDVHNGLLESEAEAS